MKGNLKMLITAALTATMTVGFLPQVAIKAEEKNHKYYSRILKVMKY